MKTFPQTFILLSALLLLPGCDVIDDLFGGSDDSGHWAPPTSAGPAQSSSYFNTAIGTVPLFHWTQLPGKTEIDLFIEIADGPTELPAGISTESARNLVHVALNQWQDALTPTFQFHFAYHSEGQSFSNGETTILVQYVPDFGQGTAWTRPQWISNRLTHISIEYPIAFHFGGTTPLNQPLMTHEFGHALGSMGMNPSFSGHSFNQADVMYPTPQANQPSLGDISTLNQVYSLQPQLLRADSFTNLMNDGSSGPSATNPQGLLESLLGFDNSNGHQCGGIQAVHYE